jgi:hypothetical protein
MIKPQFAVAVVAAVGVWATPAKTAERDVCKGVRPQLGAILF